MTSPATNPFDDEDTHYRALVNATGEHSLWPTFIPVPAGWTETHGPASRQDCLDHIAAAWTDLRPVTAAADPA